MDSKSLTKLELNKIIEMTASYCMSESGKEAVRSMHPMVTALEINTALDEVDEALCYLQNANSCPVRMFDEILGSVGRAKIGASLHGGQLMSVAAFLGVSREAKSAVEGSELNLPILKSYCLFLAVDRFIENEIDRITSYNVCYTKLLRNKKGCSICFSR